jgi:site-specific DNA recombinase
MSTTNRSADPPVAAVLYGARSTEDVRGSIPTQLREARAAAEAEGREVVAEFSDEAASAYHGSRGPGLTAARAKVERLRDEERDVELWVFDPDRLARGSGEHGKAHLAQIYWWAVEIGATLRAVQNDHALRDPIYVTVEGQRTHGDSKAKSGHVKRGLQARKDRGLPVGALPEGYVVQATIENGRPITSRVVDEQRMPFVMRVMEMVETGSTFGDVSRRFNGEGLRTRSGKQWTTRAVREIVLNEDYTGVTGYPEVIDPQRHQRIVASIKRLDPVAVRSRRKGPKPAENYLLRGIASCGYCGSSLYTRRYKRIAGERAYVCAAVREARGTCDAKPIPAVPVEQAVVDHLDHFLANAEAWIKDRADKADKDRASFADAIAGQRTELRRLELRAERARAQWERLLDAGDDDAADAALRGIDRLEGDARHLAEAITAAEAKLEDWPTADVDAALDFYSDVRDAIGGRVRAAKGFDDLAAALRSMLARVDLEVDGEGVPWARFELAHPGVDSGEVPLFVFTRDRGIAGRPIWPAQVGSADQDTKPWCRSSR